MDKYKEDLDGTSLAHQCSTCCISFDSRPIKIRPGTYCRGDSAHAL